MENYIILGLIVFAVILLKLISANRSHKKKVFKNNDFFRTLNRVAGGRYYVFPQVHLSAILDHKVKGQEWKYAFRHINGKSVDYVLCDKATLQPTYAVELDDYTHDQKDRRERDREVERIFAAANLPLVRFKDKNVSDDDITQALMHARKKHPIPEQEGAK